MLENRFCFTRLGSWIEDERSALYELHALTELLHLPRSRWPAWARRSALRADEEVRTFYFANTAGNTAWPVPMDRPLLVKEMQPGNLSFVTQACSPRKKLFSGELVHVMFHFRQTDRVFRAGGIIHHRGEKADLEEWKRRPALHRIVSTMSQQSRPGPLGPGRLLRGWGRPPRGWSSWIFYPGWVEYFEQRRWRLHTRDLHEVDQEGRITSTQRLQP